MELGGAITLAIGMGIQNAPEGFAVSMPLRELDFSKIKSWKWGQLSAASRTNICCYWSSNSYDGTTILPYALAFSAGAMIFIVVEEVIPESQRGGNTDLAGMGLIAEVYSYDDFRCLSWIKMFLNLHMPINIKNRKSKF